MNDYARGFEDALELALHIVTTSRHLEEARRRLEDALYAMKERKVEVIKRRLMFFKS